MIVIFDAQCLLCNAWVQFLLKRDTRDVFQFASIQSKTGQALLTQAGLPLKKLDTLLVLDGLKSWRHTAAILQVLNALGGFWRLAWIGWLVPWFLRDAAYKWIARNRYHLFGKSEVCLMPANDYKHKFLD